MAKKRIVLIGFLATLTATLLLDYFWIGKPSIGDDGRIMVLSISSDGKYVVSTDISQHLVLWDIPHRRYQVLAKKINIYSPRFLPDTHIFIYQSNRNDRVIIETVEGKRLKTFSPGFPSYGELMTPDLREYCA